MEEMRRYVTRMAETNRIETELSPYLRLPFSYTESEFASHLRRRRHFFQASVRLSYCAALAGSTTSTSSISKINIELGGMLGLPRSP